MTETAAPPAATTAPVVATSVALVSAADIALDVERVIRDQRAIDRLVEQCMVRDVHYGVIPGTEKANKKPGQVDKPVLYQAGAELLCNLFRMRIEYEVMKERQEDRLIMYRVRARAYHYTTGLFLGEAIGSANSREKKYVNQTTARVCPSCGTPAIIKGREDYGGGWLCYAKKQGCGAKFKDGDPSIEDQLGEQNSAAVWDLDNTIFKIACKRGLVSVTRTVTGMAGRFDVDLDDEDHDDDQRWGDGSRGRQGGSQQPGTTTNQQRADARQAGAWTVVDGTTPAAGGDTPPPARSGEPLMTQDQWKMIDEAKGRAGIPTRELFVLIKKETGKDRPPDLVDSDVPKVLAALKAIEDEKGKA